MFTPTTRRLRHGILLRGRTIVLVAALVVILTLSVSHRADASPRPATCALSALRFNLQPNGGLGHGAFRVVVRNAGSSACSLSGYPRVLVPLDDHRDPSVQRSSQRVMPPGSRASVHDTISTYAGGYSGPVTKSGRVTLPRVELSARTGVASFNIEWIEISPKACPIAQDLEIGLRGNAANFTNRQVLFVCSGVEVTPFVPGDSGSWN